jgi:preprotein translocase subunit SecD
MAILLIERGRGEVITAPVIRDRDRRRAGADLRAHDDAGSLRRRAAAARRQLAAPMQIIEERTVGPSLGAENIAKRLQRGDVGLHRDRHLHRGLLLAVRRVLGRCADRNLMLLIALLSLLQATLTLPGMAAIALTLGMAIDANVLINERIREELRNGVHPQAAITAGYERAWTPFWTPTSPPDRRHRAAGFGSGPVRGFAVVLCLGILTSMFSAVTVFSRAMANLTYGRQPRLTKLSI